MCETGVLTCYMSEIEYFKVSGNHFCRFSDSLLPSAVVDLLCEEAVHEQESLRPWAVKQNGNNFKHFHSKIFKSFAFVLDTFCTKEELSAYEVKKKKPKPVNE